MKPLFTIMLLVLLSVCCIACSEPKEKEVLTLGTNPEFPPFEMRSEEDNEIIGFDIDIARIIADRLNKRLEIKDMPFENLLGALDAGEVDLVIAGLTITPERKELVDFSDSYYTVTQVVLVRKKNPPEINSLDDLKDKKVGVAIETTGDTAASLLTKEVTRYDTAFDAVADLKKKKTDLVLVDEALGEVLLSKNPDLKRITLPFPEEDYAVAVKKGNKALLNTINSVLEGLEKSGKKYFLLELYFSN